MTGHDPVRRPVYIGHEIYRGSTYGPKHPLAIPRVPVVTDLVRALGWLPDSQFLTSPQATPEDLLAFHTPDYITALQRAEATQAVTDADRARHRIGADGNPVYREIFRRPATGAGGVLLAAALTADGGIVHVPGGGTHHGRPDRASGFCYLNDCVLGVLAWLVQGLTRVLYLDLDAHHGDGVQDAFADDPRVLTLSIHEAGRWPFSGALEDRAGGMARNIPVPQGYHDAEAALVLEEAILPIIDRWRPQAVMIQAGADSLAEDPLARLSLTNAAYRATLAAVMPRAPRLILLGGGGYNPWSVGRCWAGLWATLNGLAVPDRLPPVAEAVLRAQSLNRAAGRNPPGHWFTTLADAPAEPLPVRDALRQACAAVRQGIPPGRG